MKRMFLVVLLAGAIAGFGCTTLEPVAATPEEVQRQLLAGQLLEPGEVVRLVTTDEVVHKFKVVAVDFAQGYIRGRDEQVAITDVVALETSKVSVGRTTLLVGGVGIGAAALIAIIVAPAVFLGG